MFRPTQSLDLGLGSSWVGQLPITLPYLQHLMGSPALPQIAHPTLQLVGGRVSSPALMSLGPALLYLQHQSQLHCAAKAWDRGSSPPHPLQHHPVTSQQMSGGAISPALLPSSWFTDAPSTRASSTVLPRQGAGPALLSAAASEGQGQLSLQVS